MMTDWWWNQDAEGRDDIIRMEIEAELTPPRDDTGQDTHVNDEDFEWRATFDESRRTF